jgi:hypothetical protein
MKRVLKYLAVLLSLILLWSLPAICQAASNAGETAATTDLGMTVGGWAMLIISWSAILGLGFFCFRLLLKTKD